MELFLEWGKYSMIPRVFSDEEMNNGISTVKVHINILIPKNTLIENSLPTSKMIYDFEVLTLTQSFGISENSFTSFDH
jgi:hypothetical protein